MADSYKIILALIRDKGTPPARVVRKATGLDIQHAGLPNGEAQQRAFLRGRRFAFVARARRHPAVDALLVTWQFWTGVLVFGLISLGTIIRWIVMGDGRTPTEASSVQAPLSLRHPRLAQAHPTSAIAHHGSPSGSGPP